MTIPLALRLPAGSSRQPGPLGAKFPCHAAHGPYSALLPVGLAVPVLLPVPRWAFTPPFHPYPDMQGGLFSVALSLGLPPPGVTRHRHFMESGLSSTPRLSAYAELRGAAVIQPSAREVPYAPRAGDVKRG